VTTLLGYDGADFTAVKTDSDGHVQVDTLSSALPSGAATAAKQDTMITALQKIDDLQGALVSVGTDTLRANVLSSALPAGAATEAMQYTLKAAVDNVATLKTQGDAYGRQQGSATGTAATWTTIVTATVPAGKTWYITGFGGYNSADNVTTQLRLRVATSVRMGLKTTNESAQLGGFCLGRATAAQDVDVQAYVTGSTNKAVYAWYTYTET
jgi:hypothetical protein